MAGGGENGGNHSANEPNWFHSNLWQEKKEKNFVVFVGHVVNTI
jgi:hypothetical protein